MQSVGVELQGSFQASFTLNLHDGVGAADHFNQTNAISQWKTAIGKHPGNTQKEYSIQNTAMTEKNTEITEKQIVPQVQSLTLPNILHDFDNLQSQHVLP